MKILNLSIVLVSSILLCGCGNKVNYQNQASSYSNGIPTPSPSRYRQEQAIVRRGSFKKKKLLNREEEKIYWKIFNFCKGKNLKVFAQVSLGELLSSNGDEYRTINSKRVDFCITDRNFFPIAVIEYQGSGHINDTSEERDEVKRLAVESAEIKYIPINVSDENSILDTLNSYFPEYITESLQ